MSEKSKEMMEQLAEVVKSLPEEAAVNALSHATARAEGLAAGIDLGRTMAEAQPTKKEESA